MPETNKVLPEAASRADIEKLEKLLHDNLASNAAVLKSVNDIKKYIRWQQIWSTFRFFLIAVPIVLGFIYLPPLIKDAIQYYKSLLIN